MQASRRLSVRAEQASLPVGRRVQAVLGNTASAGTPAPARIPTPGPAIVSGQHQQEFERQQLQLGQGTLVAGAQTAAVPPCPSAVQDALVRPEATAAAAMAFGAVALAVFCSPDHPIHAVDAAAHAAVRSSTTAAWRLEVAELIISNGPIAAGLAAWAAASATALAAGGPRRAAVPLAACGLFNLFAAGPGGPGLPDPLLVHELKQAFARVRPSVEIHTTYAFPSGHTTAATFIVGAALLVLMPLAARLAAERGNNSSNSSGTGRLPDAVVLPIWMAAVATTACGRVLADAHWVSDTLAGAALGVGCVSALAQVVAFLERAFEPPVAQQSVTADDAAAAGGHAADAQQ